MSRMLVLGGTGVDGARSSCHGSAGPCCSGRLPPCDPSSRAASCSTSGTTSGARSWSEAHRLEAEGHKILKLNIGNPAPFGFEAPEAIVADIVHNLPESQGYSDSRGIYSARTAVAQYYQSRGLPETVVDDVYIGNGVSELITMTLQAFLDDGNEILVPAPDYPLWTGAVTLSGGYAGALPLRRGQRVGPGPRRHRGQDHPADPGPGDHQPQQPHRCGLQRGDRPGTGRHRPPPRAGGVQRRDLREDPVRRRGAPPHGGVRGRRRAVPDLQRPVEGLPRLRLPRRLGDGVRSQAPRRGLPRGPDPARNMRMCPNVPAQHAIQTALGGYQSINEYIVPGGRFYEQSKTACAAAQRDPRGQLRRAPRRALLLPAARPGRLPRSRTTRSSSSTCSGRRRSWSPTAPASTGSSPTTSGW